MTIVIALLLFGIIILIHEFGHFLLAKKNGVTVHEFSIGMGPKIYSREKNGTEYSLRILPIGGYVSMEGEEDGFDRSEEDDDLDNAEDNSLVFETKNDREEKNEVYSENEIEVNEGSFAEKTVLQRASIIFAGPFFNFLGCIGFLVVLFLIIGVPTTKVGTLVDNAPAQAVGIKVGDEIKEVNGQEVTSSTDITNIISASKGKEINLVVNRDGKDVEFDLSPKFSKDTQTYIIGITFDRTKNIIKSFTTSITTTWDIAVQMVEFLGQLVTGRVAGGLSNSVAGPVGVIGMVSDRYRGRDFFWDPFCGSGTIVIEAALAALNRAPGLARKFAAQSWSCIPEDVWTQAREAARAAEFRGEYRILGTDIDSGSLAIAIANAKKAGVSKYIEFREADATRESLPCDRGLIVCNPPYGERMLEQRSAQQLMRQFGRHLRFADGWKKYIISSEPEFEHYFGKQATKKRKLYNGRLQCNVYMYF